MREFTGAGREMPLDTDFAATSHGVTSGLESLHGKWVTAVLSSSQTPRSGLLKSGLPKLGNLVTKNNLVLGHDPDGEPADSLYRITLWLLPWLLRGRNSDSKSTRKSHLNF